MGKINYKSDECTNAIIINYNISYGNDPQPLYEAGSPNIACVVEMEALAQVAISKAIFKDDQFTTDASSGSISVTAPSINLTNAVVKYNYSASSGQAYIVEQLQIIGKKE